MSSDGQLSTTDILFLETRFQILSGAYLPGSILDRDEVCAVYGCSPRLVLDVFNALKAEGYLDVPKRGFYGVRIWDSNQLEDYYDLWATVVGVAAARAAERADQKDLLKLQSILSLERALDLSQPDCVERHLIDYVLFTVKLVQISRAAPLMSISSTAIPNFLFRRSIWSSSAKELSADRKALDSVVELILERSSTFAKDRLRELIMRTLPTVQRDMDKKVTGDSNAVIARPSFPLKRAGAMFGLGGREVALDGKIVAYGTKAN